MAIGWIAAGTALASIVGSSMQASAAQSAAQSQQQAALYQANLAANIYTANQVNNLPTRELGGLAQQQEGYLLGLTPNLNISPDFSVATVSPNVAGTGGITYSGPGSTGVNNILNNTGTPTGSPTQTPGPAVRPLTGVTGGQLSPGGLVPGPNGSMIPGGIQANPGGSPTGVPGYSTTAPGSSATGSFSSPTGAPGGSINPVTGTPNSSTTSGGYGSLMNPYNPSTFFLSPDYNFLMSQGSAAINRASAAGGNTGGTGAVENSLKFASGLASTDYNQAFTNSLAAQAQQFNLLQSTVNGGNVATQSTVNAGNSATSALGSAATGYGNAGAAGTIGGANAWSSGLNSVGNTATSGALAVSNPNSPFYNPNSPLFFGAGGGGGGGTVNPTATYNASVVPTA